MHNNNDDKLKAFLNGLKKRPYKKITTDFEEQFFRKLERAKSKKNDILYRPQIIYATGFAIGIVLLITFLFETDLFTNDNLNSTENFGLDSKITNDSQDFVSSNTTDTLANRKSDSSDIYPINYYSDNFKDHPILYNNFGQIDSNSSWELESPLIGIVINNSYIPLKATIKGQLEEKTKIHVYLGDNLTPILVQTIKLNIMNDYYKIDGKLELKIPGKYSWKITCDKELLYTGFFYINISSSE